MPEYQLKSRILSIYYVLCAIALSVLCYDYYLQGFYPLTLTGSASIPLFLFAAIYHFIQRDNPTHYYVDLLLLLCITSLILYQIGEYPDFMLHWAFSLPLISFFILPLSLALVMHLTMLSLIGGVFVEYQNVDAAIRAATNYGLLTGSAWCYAYLAALKNQSLKRLAITDYLTGAYNKKHLMELLKQEIARSQATGNHLGLIALEIDDFQQMNDIHGRGPTNQLLKNFTEELRKLTRAGDEVFREADSQFFLLLPNCSKDGAIVLKERLRRHIDQLTWEPISEITIVTGVVALEPGMNEAQLYENAISGLRRSQQNSLRLLALSS